MNEFNVEEISKQITSDLASNDAEAAYGKLLEAANHPTLSENGQEFIKVLKTVARDDNKGYGADLFTNVSSKEWEDSTGSPFFDVLPNEKAKAIYSRAQKMDRGNLPFDRFDISPRVRKALNVTEKKREGWDIDIDERPSWGYRNTTPDPMRPYKILWKNFQKLWPTIRF